MAAAEKGGRRMKTIITCTVLALTFLLPGSAVGLVRKAELPKVKKISKKRLRARQSVKLAGADSANSKAITKGIETAKIQLEDPQIRGLKLLIYKNSHELNFAKWFLDEAYDDGVIPLSRELAEINGKILDKQMKGIKVSKQDLKEKKQSEKNLRNFKKWLKPTELKVRKLEKENKALSVALHQYILVAN
jgi:hypothetical protein